MELEFIKLFTNGNVWYIILGFPAIMAAFLLYFTRKDLKDVTVALGNLAKNQDKMTKAILLLVLSENGTKKHAKNIAKQMLRNEVLDSNDLDDELVKNL